MEHRLAVARSGLPRPGPGMGFASDSFGRAATTAFPSSAISWGQNAATGPLIPAGRGDPKLTHTSAGRVAGESAPGH